MEAEVTKLAHQCVSKGLPRTSYDTSTDDSKDERIIHQMRIGGQIRSSECTEPCWLTSTMERRWSVLKSIEEPVRGRERRPRREAIPQRRVVASDATHRSSPAIRLVITGRTSGVASNAETPVWARFQHHRRSEPTSTARRTTVCVSLLPASDQVGIGFLRFNAGFHAHEWSVDGVPGFVPRLRDPGVTLFRADDRVFEAMVDGWRTQMLARGLAVDTIKTRTRVVEPCQLFTGDYPWTWRPVDIEDYLGELRSRDRPIGLTTLRSYSNAVPMFCAYLTHPGYGWGELCERTFGDVPAQICFDWNTPRHTTDDAAPPPRSRSTSAGPVPGCGRPTQCRGSSPLLPGGSR
jgi:hypothetical protein